MNHPETKSIHLARHYARIGRWDQALEALDASGPAALDDPDAWAIRALSLHQLDRNDEARRALERGLSLAPEHVYLLHILAHVEGEAKDLAGAERAILAALRLDPDDAGLLCTYASLVAGAGQHDKAERLLDAAADLDPDETEVLVRRAELRRLQGRDAEAARLTRELLARDPENTRGKAMLVVHSAERGDVRTAARSVAELARDDVSNRRLAEAAREGRVQNHPLMWPLIPFQRVGSVGAWIGAMVILFGLRALGFPTAATVFAFTYLGLVIYSWVMPPLLRRIILRR